MLEKCLSAALNHFPINRLRLNGTRPEESPVLVVYPRDCLRTIRLHGPSVAKASWEKAQRSHSPRLSLDLVQADFHGHRTTENAFQDKCDLQATTSFKLFQKDSPRLLAITLPK